MALQLRYLCFVLLWRLLRLKWMYIILEMSFQQKYLFADPRVSGHACVETSFVAAALVE